MNKRIEQMLSTLLVDENAKNALRKADMLLNSTSKSVSNYIPLVIAKEGCGFSSFGRVYSAIVDESPLLRVKGSATLLELVFPKDNEIDEKLFFASPRRLASIRNRFYGTMLISFKEYSGLDLINSAALKRLLKFMEDNKDNIRFMLHVTPEFSARERLISILQDLFFVEEIILKGPDVDCSLSYVLDELEKQGYEVSEEAAACLREQALPRMVAGRSYAGYKSLDRFLGRLNLETLIAMEQDPHHIDVAVIKSLVDKLEKEDQIRGQMTTKIGFSL